MKKLLLCLLIFFLYDNASSIPQSDLDSGPGFDDDLDYSQPGVPSEDCLCVPFYQCVDGEIVSDGSNIIDPRRKPQEEEVKLVSEAVYHILSI